jgi:hypothetical protein
LSVGDELSTTALARVTVSFTAPARSEFHAA